MPRDFVGIVAAFPEMLRPRRTRTPGAPIAERCERCEKLSQGSPAWRYLTE